jgi:hypothetical protein
LNPPAIKYRLFRYWVCQDITGNQSPNKKSQPDYCPVKSRTTVDWKGLIAVTVPFAIPTLAKAGIKHVANIISNRV